LIQNASSLNGTTFSYLSPGELLANSSKNSIGTDTYTISALVESASPITGIFLDAIKNPALPGGGPGEYSNGNFVVSEFTLDAATTGGSTTPFTVDTTIPAVMAIVETPSRGDLNAGKTATITLTTSEAVIVTGTPTAMFNDGGTATYDAGKSTATSLVFDYTVAASDTDVPSLQVSSINLPSGATIQDAAGNNANLSLTGLSQSGPQIDTTVPATPPAPTDSAVVNGYVNAANNTSAQLLTGSAEDGTTVTIYDNGTQVGTTAADPSTGAWSFLIGQLPNGSTQSYTVTATDAAGNVSQPSAALNFVVDTTAPTVAVSIDNTVVNVANPTGLVTFTFSKPPTDFSLNDVTSADGSLSNLSGSGTTYAAMFTANPGVDDNAATVSVINGSYHDVAGNAGTGGSTMSSAVKFSSAIATFYEIQNDWAPSQMIDGIFTGPNGGINGWAVYNYATGTSEAADALLTLANPLPAGQYNLTFTIYQNYYGNPGHLLGDFALDYTTAASPTLSSPQTPVSIQSASSLNETTFSLLSPGELLANSSKNSIGTDTYTISALVDSASPITGIFLDAIKNPALPGGGPGGQYGNGNFVVSEFTLDAGAPFTVDTVTPTVTAIAETPGSGDLNAGKTATITLTTSEAVAVTGTPTLALNDNGTATYSGVSADGKTLTFTYTVASADTDVASLQVTSVNLPSGATIQDAAGNNLSLSLSSVPTYSGPQIDTDTGEQAALRLTFSTTAISASTALAVPFTIAGLQSEDTGMVTFTDVNGNTVTVAVDGSQTGYLANLSSLADGTIKSSLVVNVDTPGNTFTAVPGTSVTLTQLDHWTNSSGGNWTTGSSWTTWNGTHAVPTGTIEADFDKSGTYTVKITTADTAYALLLNDAGATISDNSGGTLTLAGTGGSTNPNGMLAINGGTFALAGGALNSGAISIAGGSLTISGNYTGNRAISQAITDNGTMTISGSAAFAGAITGSGIVNIQKGAAATFTGTITGSETFNISGTMTISGDGRAVISTPVSGTGSFILSNSASLEFAARDSENITFSPGATGSLKFDDSLNPQFFTGQLSGLSTQGGNSVDLADLLWVQGKMSASYKGTPKGGTLTISNGTNKVSLNLSGNYIGASWMLSQDGGTGTLVKDPPVSGSFTPRANGGAAGNIDLFGISSGPNTTLAYSASNDHTGSTLTASDGLHAQSVALLAQYMASSFVMASGGHGGTLITEPPSNQQLFLAHPHA